MIFKLCMFAVFGATVVFILKEWKGDFVPLLRISLTVIVGISVFQALSPLISYLETLSNSQNLSDVFSVLLKALGIALLTDYCASICKDCGESGTATSIEFAGKVEILLLCIPFVNEIIQKAEELFSFDF